MHHTPAGTGDGSASTGAQASDQSDESQTSDGAAQASGADQQNDSANAASDQESSASRFNAADSDALKQPSLPANPQASSPESRSAANLAAQSRAGSYNTTGGLTVTGGTLNQNFTYGGNVLTVTSAPASAPLTISGTTTADRIVIKTGTTANLTISGLSIDVGSVAGGCALDDTGATLNLSLQGTNTLKSGSDKAGLQVPDGAVLTIRGGGTLNASGGVNSAGIGAGGWLGVGGSITIEGGTVTASSGGHGAGIGGGNNGGGGSVVIKGGIVTASSGDHGAGIGGGDYGGSGGSVTITGGSVTAIGGQFGASGIGGGHNGDNNWYGGKGGNGATVTISGGKVVATGGGGGAGIGGGNGVNKGGNGGAVTISGGTVAAQGSNSAKGIGAGKGINSGPGANGSFATTAAGNAFMVANGISDTSKTGQWSGVIFGGTSNNSKAGQVYGHPTLAQDNVIPAGSSLAIPANTGLTIGAGAQLTSFGLLSGAGSFTNRGTFTNNGGLVVKQAPSGVGTMDGGALAITGGVPGADVDYGNHLVTVKSSAPLTATGTTTTDCIKIKAGTTANLTADNLSIDAHTNTPALDDTGAKLNLTLAEGSENMLKGGPNDAGIYVPLGSTLSIDGKGSLHAIGSQFCAGIGGMHYAASGTITINGGTITAESGEKAAAIGGGSGGSGAGKDSKTTINGGTVTAHGGLNGAGIGEGSFDAFGTITITGGTVYATGGGSLGAGIGPSNAVADKSGTINITGGTVVATGGPNAYALGNNNDATTVTITGGTVIAKGTTSTNGSISKNFSTASATVPKGNAFIDANSIEDQSHKTSWSGVILQGGAGQVYGTPTLATDAAIDSGKTLDVPLDHPLAIGNSATLANNGTITNKGGITGRPEALAGTGITNSSSQVSLSFRNIGAFEDEGDLVATVTQSATTPGTPAVGSGKVTFKLGSTVLGTGDLVPDDHGSAAATLKMTPEVWAGGGAAWQKEGANTITAAYTPSASTGQFGLLANMDTGTLVLKKAIHPSVSIEGWTFGEAAHDPILDDASNPGHGGVSYFYKEQTAPDTSYSAEVPSAAGKYRVKAVVASAGEYAGGTGFKDFTIEKAAQDKPIVVNLGRESVRDRGDGHIGGLATTMEWAHKGSAAYTGVDDVNHDFTPGVYEVRYAADANHNASQPVEVTIDEGNKLSIGLPEPHTGYALTASPSEVGWNDVSTLTIVADEGWSTADAIIKANGIPLTKNSDGTYALPAPANLDHAADGISVQVSSVKDVAAPTASLSLGQTTWEGFDATGSFTSFNEGAPTLDVSASDAQSGIQSVAYLVSNTSYAAGTALPSEGWHTLALSGGKAKITLAAQSKQFVYLKVTDEGGNVTYVGTPGIVCYSLPTLTPDSAAYSPARPSDVAIVPEVNANTFADVMAGGESLSPNDYTWDETSSTLTLKSDYLLSVAKQQASLALDMKFAPMGEGGPDHYLSVRFTIELDKVPTSPQISIENWIYGATPSTPAVVAGTNPGGGEPVFEYKQAGDPDDSYSESVPTQAGDYTVRASVPEAGRYLAGSATQSFTISKATLTPPSDLSASGTYGQALSDMPLEGGEVLSDGSGKPVEGSWAFQDASIKPPAGSAEAYAAVFTPSADATNYHVLTLGIAPDVARAVPTVDTPTIADIFYFGQTLSQVALPQGWTWVNPSQALTLGSGGYKARTIVDASDVNYDYTKVDGYVSASGNEATIERTVALSVAQSGTNLTAATQDGKASFTYGDDITVTGSVTPTGAAPGVSVRTARSLSFAVAINVLVAPTAGQVALFAGGTQLGDAVTPDPVTGSFALSYHTTDKLLAASGQQQTLTVRFVSNDQLTAASTSLTLTLSPRPLAIEGVRAQDKVYDALSWATEDQAGSLTGWDGATPDADAGVVSGDEVYITAGALAFQASSVGSHAVSATGYSIGGKAVSNYRLVDQPSVPDANITARPLTVTGIKVDDKVYDGTVVAHVSGGVLVGAADPAAGVVPADAENIAFTLPTATFDDKKAGDDKQVRLTGDVTLSGSAAGNYALTQPAGLTANITARLLAVTGIKVDDKVYDGTDGAHVSGGVLVGAADPAAGVVPADAENIAFTLPTATFDDKKVGDDKQVSLTGDVTLSGSAAGNYALTQPAGLTANITARLLAIAGVTAKSRPFVADDASAAIDNPGHLAATGDKDSGPVQGDDVRITPGTLSFADAKPGVDKPVAAAGFGLAGADKDNYALTAQPKVAPASIFNVRVEPDGTVVLPGGGGEVGGDNGTSVKPSPGSSAVINPDSSVTLPDGGTVTNPEGGSVVVPGGSVVQPDGSVVIPEGGGALTPSGGKPVVVPGGSVVQPDGSISVPGDGVVVIPGASGDTTLTPVPGGSVVVGPDGTVVFPQGGSMVLPDGSVVHVAPGGSLAPDGTITGRVEQPAQAATRDPGRSAPVKLQAMPAGLARRQASLRPGFRRPCWWLSWRRRPSSCQR